MFHLRYTHVFIVYSAWILGESPICKRQSGLIKRFSTIKKHKAGAKLATPQKAAQKLSPQKIVQIVEQLIEQIKN